MKFPRQPGVYLFKDKEGRIIYAGKAKSLKERVSSYFQKPITSQKTEALLAEHKKIDFIVTPTELEALLLERKLIKKYKPRFNVMWRDDKQYPYLKLTLNEEWPRLIIARKKDVDGARYFGPYESRSVRETISLMKRLFPIRWCKETPLKFRQQPCLQYHLKHCWAPCIGGISREEYFNFLKAMIEILEGNISSALKSLKDEMEEAAKSMRFELAAKLRDRIKNLSRILEKKPGWMPKQKEMAGDTGIWEIKNALGLIKTPNRIEAFDVSNLQGENIVAAMVTFKEGEPLKSDYRKFKIEGINKPNDVAAVYQAVLRRYTGGLRDKMASPDLIMIDGGLAQANYAASAAGEAKLRVAVVGLAKKNEEIYFPGKNLPLKLPLDSAALKLLRRVRDEAHRFAITYQRSRRRLVK